MALGLELLAQVADVHVDRARVAVGGVAPDALEQHRAAEHAAGVARERGQDLELHVGEPHGLVARGHLAALEVDHQLALADRLLELLVGLRQRRAPQHGLHAAAELAHREGLGDVVVGAQLQAEHLVDLLGLGGEHDDRHGAARADLAADVEAVELGQHHVEHDEVEAVLAQPVERLAAVERGDDVVALLAQRVGEQLLHRQLVVHEQDPGC